MKSLTPSLPSTNTRNFNVSMMVEYGYPRLCLRETRSSFSWDDFSPKPKKRRRKLRCSLKEKGRDSGPNPSRFEALMAGFRPWDLATVAAYFGFTNLIGLLSERPEFVAFLFSSLLDQVSNALHFLVKGTPVLLNAVRSALRITSVLVMGAFAGNTWATSGAWRSKNVPNKGEGNMDLVDQGGHSPPIKGAMNGEVLPPLSTVNFFNNVVNHSQEGLSGLILILFLVLVTFQVFVLAMLKIPSPL